MRDAGALFAVNHSAGKDSQAMLIALREAGIPDDQVIQTCVAMGWPDDTFPANAVVSTRKSVDEAAVFRGFQES